MAKKTQSSRLAAVEENLAAILRALNQTANATPTDTAILDALIPEKAIQDALRKKVEELGIKVTKTDVRSAISLSETFAPEGKPPSEPATVRAADIKARSKLDELRLRAELERDKAAGPPLDLRSQELAAAQEKSLRNLFSLVEKGKSKLPSQSVLENQIKLAELPSPAVGADLRAKLESLRTSAEASTQQAVTNLLTGKVPTDEIPSIANLVASRARDTGVALTEKDPFLRTVVNEALNEREIASLVQKRQTPGFFGASLKEPEIAAISKIAKTDPLGAKSLLERAVKGAKGRRLGRLGIPAALLSAFILPRLFGNKEGGGQQQLPPALQLQLATQLAQLQNNQALTQSLVGSRAASANKLNAQADLIRLQQLLSLGGLGKQGGIV